MKSQGTEQFWVLYRQLPPEEKRRARHAYQLWRNNPRYNSLRFKRVNRRQPIYSIRVGDNYRALGLFEGDTVTWYWIGTHADYDKLLGS